MSSEIINSKNQHEEREGANHSFSFFRKPITTSEPIRCIGVSDLYRYIVNPKFAGMQTEKLRNITDENEARKYEAENFDFCTFSGVFQTRSKDGLQFHSGLLCVEFYHVSDISSLKEKLLHDEYFETELMFRSPSGEGIKWVIAIDLRGWEHSLFCKSVYNYLIASGYPEPDTSFTDVTHACFIPFDPEVYLNPKYNAKENIQS